MTGRPDAGPDGTTPAARPRPTPAQARFAADRLREHARTARQLAAGQRATGDEIEYAREHDWSAAAYEAAARALEDLAAA